jgi:ATP-binding cassette subfamily B protein
MALTIYLFQLMGQLRSFGGIYENYMVRSVSVDRFLETFDAEVEINDTSNAVCMPIKGSIEFKNVFFGYTADNPVFENLSFRIEAGETVGLVGHSGIGKTTIINLLLRLYEPQSGKVLVDGYDIKKFKMPCLREQIGVVPQESFVTNGTIAEAIRFGKPEAGLAEIKAAAEIADASEFILNLPEGYDTNVGEAGCHLSEGQRQRIAIARATVKKPAILVLDEAVSSISSDSEARIMEALAARKITTIIITHRLSSLAGCDNIFVLDKGKIAEKGTHVELIKNTQSLYRELFSKQFENLDGKENEPFPKTVELPWMTKAKQISK